MKRIPKAILLPVLTVGLAIFVVKVTHSAKSVTDSVVSEKWIRMNLKGSRQGANGHNVTSDMTTSLDPFLFVLIAVSGWMG
jgi:hypothetical protein